MKEMLLVLSYPLDLNHSTGGLSLPVIPKQDPTLCQRIQHNVRLDCSTLGSMVHEILTCACRRCWKSVWLWWPDPSWRRTSAGTSCRPSHSPLHRSLLPVGHSAARSVGPVKSRRVLPDLHGKHDPTAVHLSALLLYMCRCCC